MHWHSPFNLVISLVIGALSLVRAQCPAGQTTALPDVTGGTVFSSGGSTVNQFTNNGTLVVGQSVTADVLVIGGGAGGGPDYSGGGGAGALIFYPGYTLPAGNYPVTIGGGGSPGYMNQYSVFYVGQNGQDTSLGSLFVARGGGRGGKRGRYSPASDYNGVDGGSGGGCSSPNDNNSPLQTPGNPVTNNVVGSVTGPSSYAFGNRGGYNNYKVANQGGGGGGAGVAGGNGTDKVFGLGGDGLANVTISGVTYVFASIFGAAYTQVATQNDSLYYVAGGGDGAGVWNPPTPVPTNSGGRGGGGRGCFVEYTGGYCQAGSGKPNTGGGGGSADYTTAVGGSGGSGLVLVRTQAQCTPCAAGLYMSASGLSACSQCQAGQYSTGVGMTVCGQCTAGQYSSGVGFTVCAQCSAGTYSTATGVTVCVGCPRNSWSAAGATVCVANAGYYDLGTSQTFYYGFDPGNPLRDSTGITGSLVNSNGIDVSSGYANVKQANATGWPVTQIMTFPAFGVYPAFSVCWWFLPTNPGRTVRFFYTDGYVDMYNIGSTFGFHLTGTSGTVDTLYGYVSPDACWTLNVWQHTCVAFNSTNVTVYCNGTSRSLASSVGTLSPGALRLPFGPYTKAMNTQNNIFVGGYKGLYDDQRLVNVTLSALEVTTMFNLGFGDSSNMLMMPCPAGKYSTGTGTSSVASCVSCSAGTYSTAQAATVCASCAAGEYSSASGVTACQSCASGLYSTGTGMTSSAACSNCAAGTYSSAAGSTACTTCTVCSASATRYSPCVAQGQSRDSTVCVCNTGYSGNGTSCLPCAAGRISQEVAGVSINLTSTCSPGTCTSWMGAVYAGNIASNGAWKALDGSVSTGCHSACSGSPHYWAVDFEQAVSVAAVRFWDRQDCCQSRENGMQVYVGDELQTGAVYVRNGTNNTLCYTDPGGSIYLQRIAGMVFSCTARGRYLYLVSGQADCFHFNEVQVWGTRPPNNSVTSTCVNCSAGVYSSAAGSGVCANCSAGSYSTGSGVTVCASCAAGTYASGLGQTVCQTCNSGESSAGTGASACLQCAAGGFKTPAATGGTAYIDVTGYTVYRFTSSGTLVLSSNAIVDVLVIGGGGGGSGQVGGGGGAGAIVFYMGYSVAAGSLTITVGNGGNGGAYTNPSVWSQGTNGGDSSVGGAFVAKGGGYGGYGMGGSCTTNCYGNAGGCGGGGGGTSTGSTATGGAASTANVVAGVSGASASAKGFAGGNGRAASSGQTAQINGGGGGGTGAAGAAATTTACGIGGDGLTNFTLDGTAYVLASVFGQAYTSVAIVNNSQYYVAAGGGGGGWVTGSPMYCLGGRGGGGTGCRYAGTCPGDPGKPNTGSGGGSAGSYSVAAGGAGGSGLVLVRVPICTLCGAGKYSTAVGANSSSVCTQCGGGTYSTTVGASGSSVCAWCLAGSYQSVNQTYCISAEAGRYVTGSGLVASVACQVGTYSSGVGMTSSAACVACAAGGYSTGTGMPTSAACVGCVAGAYSTALGATACVGCPVSSSSVSGATICVANAGYYNFDPDAQAAYYAFNPATFTADVSGRLGALTNNGNVTAAMGLSQSQYAANFLQPGGTSETGNSLIQYLALPLLQMSPRFAVCAWYYPTSVGYYARIWDFGVSAGVSNVLFARNIVNTVNAVSSIRSGSTSIDERSVPNMMQTNRWTHCCMSVDNQALRIYSNGTAVVSATMSQSRAAVNVTKAWIARSLWSTDSLFTGLIDEVRVFSRGLSAEEASAIFVESGNGASSQLFSACPAGTYSTGVGMLSSGACVQCVAGTYSTGTGMSTSAVCVACQSGKFSTGLGVTTCSACSACAANASTLLACSQYSITGLARDITTCGCNAGFQGLNPSCQACSAGASNPIGMVSLAKTCGPGANLTCSTWASSYFVGNEPYRGLDGILAYPNILFTQTGLYQFWAIDFEQVVTVTSINFWDRQECCQFREDGVRFYVGSVFQNASAYNLSVDNQLCYQDPGSSGQAARGSSAGVSITCNMTGRYLYVVNNVVQGLNIAEILVFGYRGTQTVCATCDAGLYSNSAVAATACLTCGPGLYSSAARATACTACGAGTYSTGTGVTVCTLCGWATYSTAIGATSNQCSTCPWGQYLTGTGWQSVNSCQTCPVGTFVRVAKDMCYPCVAGKYSLVPIDYEWACTWCQAGTYSTGSGMNTSATCVQCVSGAYSTGTGVAASSSCVGCLAGTYSTGTGMATVATCLTCGAGLYSTGTGMPVSSVCVACGAGLYSTVTGANSSAVCVACAAGTYSGFVGSTACAGCPSNANSVGGSSACVANAGFYDIGVSQTFYYAFTPAVPLGDSSGVTGTLTNYGAVDVSKGYANISQWNGTASGPSSQYLEMPALNLFSSFTACWWHSPFQSDVGFRAVFRLGMLGTSTVRFFQLSLDQSGRMSLAKTGVTIQWANVNPAACWTYNAWQHVCLAVNATRLNLYCNRTVRTMDSNIGGQNAYDLPTPVPPMYQGAGNYIGEYGYKGFVDDVRLFNATLSAYEVGAVFDQGFGGGGRTLAVPCPAGTYSTGAGMTSGATCVSCAAGSYSSAVGLAEACPVCPGGTYQPASGQTFCYGCPSGYWCTSGVANTCPLNSNSSAGSSLQNQCLCLAGYFGNGGLSGTSPCALCFAGQYCPGGNNNVSIGCPANSSSPAGASAVSQCQCLPGYYGPNGSPCPLCPAGAYCASGNLSVCPANSASPEGSYVVSSCVCVAGFYGLYYNCTDCPVAYYCAGGLAIQRCTGNATTASVRSWSALQCYCDRGYYGINNTACQECEAGYWCWTGIRNQCPSNSLSPAMSNYMFNCSCNAGYSGGPGGPCAACAAGGYTPSPGIAVCALCQPGRYSTGTATGCTACAAGTFATGDGAASPAECPQCAEGTYCFNGTSATCPPGTTGPRGSSSVAQCTCLGGYACQPSRTVRVTVRYNSLADSARLDAARLRLAALLEVQPGLVSLVAWDQP